MTRPAREEFVRCECGARHGQHRYGTQACPNKAWKCGNGKPQWLTRSYLPYCFAPNYLVAQLPEATA